MTITRSDTAVCAVCARAAMGIAVMGRTDRELLWLCDDATCISHAKASAAMKQDTFTAVETVATRDAIMDLFAFLHERGVDLSPLSEPDANEAGRIMIRRYRRTLKEAMGREAPF